MNICGTETKIKCQEWDNKALQERLLLHFGAVDQSCKIWMNGHFVVSHVGGYLPFPAIFRSMFIVERMNW